MRHAWMLILALVGLGLTACGGGGGGADAGGVDAFIPLRDGGNGVDTGTTPDAYARPDANVPPYDGGPAFSCTGLTPVTPADYCAAYLDAFVAEYLRCGLIGPAGEAALRAGWQCDVSRIQAAITAGHATWDASMAACCLAHSAHDTSCFLNPAAGSAECDFIHGTVANGGACNSGVECMNGYCHVDGACPGTCTAFAVPGTACNVGDVVCDANSTCDAQTHRCTTANGTAGMACSATANTGCEPTLTCLDPDGDGNGTCTALPTRGQDCDSNRIVCDFNSSICDYDFATDSGVCVPHFEIGNMRCIIDAQCAGDAYCRGASFGAMQYGTCTARAARGASCATDKCVDGLVCRPDRTCGDPPTLGQACTPASGCADALCSTGSGTCVALHAPGEPCSLNNQCASGNCSVASHTCAPECP